jgi:hypothetical protein
MLAVLDPFLFRFDDTAGLPPLPREELEDIVYMLSHPGTTVPAEPGYWRPFATDLLPRLDRRMGGDSRYKLLLRRLHDRVAYVPLAPVIAGTRLAGFDLMFDPLGPEWGAKMREVISRAVLTDATVLVTRLLSRRNARAVRHDDRVALVEKLCWELRVEALGSVHRVACVCNSRNLRVRWTCRYADGLPGHEDKAKFPFCPPADWASYGRAAFRAHQSRPAWADGLGHFWAEPAAQQATGTSYHWDVYLNVAAGNHLRGICTIRPRRRRSG